MNEKMFRELFGERPLFTFKQVAAILGPGYTKVHLNRSVKKGTIRRIGKGLYTFHSDPFIYASHIFYPSYISLSGALHFHGMTTQVPRRIEVISGRTGSFDLIEMVRSPNIWGYSKQLYNGFEVFVADSEKAVIDGILTERLSTGSIEEAIGQCHQPVLEEMTLRLGPSDMKRVGYVCSLNGIDLERVMDLIKKDRNYVRSAFFEGPNEWRVRH